MMRHATMITSDSRRELKRGPVVAVAKHGNVWEANGHRFYDDGREMSPPSRFVRCRLEWEFGRARAKPGPFRRPWRDSRNRAVKGQYVNDK